MKLACRVVVDTLVSCQSCLYSKMTQLCQCSRHAALPGSLSRQLSAGPVSGAAHQLRSTLNMQRLSSNDFSCIAASLTSLEALSAITARWQPARSLLSGGMVAKSAPGTMLPVAKLPKTADSGAIEKGH